LTAPLWTARDAAEAVGGQLTEGGWSVEGVSIDTRTIKTGDLFVALTDRRDGHDFVDAALKAGASAALVSNAECSTGPRLVVDDVLTALRQLGEAARRRSGAMRIGVTGSVGKTTVKEALAAVCRAAGRAHWSEKSYNNHWGVPLTLARMPYATQFGVFEMGMNHAGEISDLVSLVRPHVAMITKIAPAHLENLGSMEAIADAKSEIFEGLMPDGVGIIPADDEFAPRLKQAVQNSRAGFMFDFGRSERAAVRVLRYETGPDGGVGSMDVMGREFDFRLQLTGEHQAINAAAIVAAALAVSIEPDLVFDVLAKLEPAEGRGTIFQAQIADRNITVIDESYNANPESMRAALSTLKQRDVTGGGRRIAILGEMLELGPQSDDLHAGLAGDVLSTDARLIYTVGHHARALADVLEGQVEVHACDRPDDAIAAYQDRVKDGDVLLVKGSNGSGVHKIASSLKHSAL
jgi:UDP-N-acetylmuramoyl-tripeptide--D-alanyl-D-alanine ligase